MNEFWLCFVPLFIAVDAVGVLPMYMNLTDELEADKKIKIVNQSILIAMAVSILFLAIGKIILSLLKITVADFMVAGGVLLFVISINDMLTLEKKQHMVDPESLGAVPLAVPLIVGPAVLTTTILLLNEYGIMPTVVSLIINVLIAGVVFYFADNIHAVLGKAGSKTVSKLASLLLAAIAVMMVRKGIVIFISQKFCQ
jgi:multiple antibiotic resistance protein